MACEHCEEKSRNDSNSHVHGSEANWKHYALLTGVGILLLFNVVQAFQIGALQKNISPSTGAVSLSSASSSGGGGETYEQMMARMHPDQVQSSQPSSSSSNGSQMVGGC